MRLARVGQFGLEKLIKAVIDFIGHFVEQFNALDHRELAPVAFECRMARGDGRIDFGLTGFMHEADHLITDWRTFLEGFAGRNKFAINEIVKLFHGVFRGCSVLFRPVRWP